MSHRIAWAISVYLSQNSWFPQKLQIHIVQRKHRRLPPWLNLHAQLDCKCSRQPKKKIFSFCSPLLSTDHIYLPSAGCFRETRKPQSSSVKRKWLNLWTMGALLQCLFFFFFFGSSRKRPTSPESSKSTSSGENPACPHIILQFSNPPHILERHSSAVGVLGWTGTSKLMLLLLPKP